MTAGELAIQSAATRGGAAAIDEGRDGLALPIEPIPGPALDLLRADKRPEFIKFQVLDAPLWNRLGGSGGGVTDNFQDRVRTDQPTARDVPDPSSIERHWHNQFADRVDAPEIGIIGNELTPTIFAQVTLLAVGCFGILLDVQ